VSKQLAISRSYVQYHTKIADYPLRVPLVAFFTIVASEKPMKIKTNKTLSL